MVVFGGLWTNQHDSPLISPEISNHDNEGYGGGDGCGGCAGGTPTKESQVRLTEELLPQQQQQQRCIPQHNYGSINHNAPSLTGSFDVSNQRHMLTMCACYFFLYMTIAVIAFSFVFERWSIVDSLYFAVSTFTTCGYGDLNPTTEAGQIFTILFAIYGVIILGIFIGIIGHTLSEAQGKAVRRLKKKREKKVLQAMFADSEHRPVLISPSDLQKRRSNSFFDDHMWLLEDMKQVVISELPFIALVAVLALILGRREGWSLTSTLYFSIMSATTTGYGDYTPQTQADKIYCIFFLPLSVALFGEVLGRIASLYIQRQQKISESQFLQRAFTLCDLREMDTNEDDQVDMEEFLVWMLISLRKVDREFVEELRRIFNSLDRNGNGLLDKEDLVDLVEENYMRTIEEIEISERSTASERSQQQRGLSILDKYAQDHENDHAGSSSYFDPQDTLESIAEHRSGSALWMRSPPTFASFRNRHAASAPDPDDVPSRSRQRMQDSDNDDEDEDEIEQSGRSPLGSLARKIHVWPSLRRADYDDDEKEVFDGL